MTAPASLAWRPSPPGFARERRRARVFALQMLYQMEARDTTAEETFPQFWESAAKTGAETRAYTERLVRLVAENRENLDARIGKVLVRWKAERLALVDHIVLRLALAEFEDGGAPRKVVIDEAIEIAKQFGGEHSAQFVNGVLDALLPRT